MMYKERRVTMNQTWRSNKTTARRHTAVSVVHLTGINCRQQFTCQTKHTSSRRYHI